MSNRRTKHYNHTNRRDGYAIIVTGAPRQDIDVDALAQAIVQLALRLAAQDSKRRKD